MKHSWKRYLLRFFLFSVLLISAISLFLVLPFKPEKNENALLGFTFSVKAAESLGLDWKAAYDEIINELSPDIVRIPVYWDILQPEENSFSWEQTDYQLERLLDTDTKVILAVGHKLPRWPECHLPAWTSGLSPEQLRVRLFSMVDEVVQRYKEHPNLHSWQVQNELLFPFGICPEWTKNRKDLKALIALVQTLDANHPVTTSDSGELSSWLRTATLPIDALNISLYRAVYGDWHGYFYWPVNPYFYRLHAAIMRPFVEQIQISELQMEPWGPAAVQELSTAESYKSFHPYHFADRIDFAKRTGASVILAWGVEWWYYMKELREEPLYWQEALNVFQQSYAE